MADVTVIVVATVEAPTLDEAVYMDFTGPVLETIRSIEDQDFTGPLELIVVRNVQGRTVKELQRFGAEQADTTWLLFVDEGSTLYPEFIARHMPLLGDTTSYGNGLVGFNFIRRDHYLETSDGIPTRTHPDS